jgi:hypothetical protein
MPTTVSCPTCRADVPWSSASPFRPFCSRRCKLIDLGEWVSEGYRVPSDQDPTEADFDTPPDSQH